MIKSIRIQQPYALFLIIVLGYPNTSLSWVPSPETLEKTARKDEYRRTTGIPFIQHLLETGQDVTMPRTELHNKTPLEYAVKKDKDHELVQQLLSKGAQISGRSFYRAAQGQPQNFALLFKTSKERGLGMPTLLNYQKNTMRATPFLVACGQDRFHGLIEDMIDAGADLEKVIEFRGSFGIPFPSNCTCLEQAIERHATENVSILLPILQHRNSSLIHKPNRHGETPLYAACTHSLSPGMAHAFCIHAADLHEQKKALTCLLRSMRPYQRNDSHYIIHSPESKKAALSVIRMLIFHSIDPAEEKALYDNPDLVELHRDLQ